MHFTVRTVAGATIVLSLLALVSSCGDDDGEDGTQVECRLNSDCSTGQSCDSGRCITSGCTSDDECDNGATCSGGECTPNGCNSDNDCSLGQACIDGACETDVTADRDRDGVPDGTPDNPRDNCPDVPNPDQEDTDGDGFGNLCDPDIDNDGLVNADDNCPFVENPDQADSDDNNVGDACDGDFDSDGVVDALDNCPEEQNPEQVDTDNDGQGDVCDEDDDGDSVPDDGDGSGIAGDNPCMSEQTTGCDDNCDRPNPNQLDRDENGVGDFCDPDDDEDGWPNSIDNCADDSNPGQEDLDGDEIGDACDPDVDGDGILPDGDGSGTAGDNPCTAGETTNCDDNCPLVANPDQADVDGNGIGTACEGDFDGDGLPDDIDNCPSVSNPEQFDLDQDGVGDTCDDDLDGDTIPNAEDNCERLFNPSQRDDDNDTAGNPCDTDDDGDGIPDDGNGSNNIGDDPCEPGQTEGCDDNCTLVANPGQTDLDGDGLGDDCDSDREGDGIPDNIDNCPETFNPDQTDTDGDEQGNACDPDQDGDGVPNGDDNCPLVANSAQADSDEILSASVTPIPYDARGRPANEILDGASAVEGPFAIGFTVPFFNREVNQFWVSDDGYITFSDQPAATSGGIPMAATPNDLVAGWWGPQSVDSGHVYWGVSGTPPNRELVVEWDDMSADDGGVNTFQVVLAEGSRNIEVHCLVCTSVSDPFTQGIEDATGTIGETAANQQSIDFSLQGRRYSTDFVPGDGIGDACDDDADGDGILDGDEPHNFCTGGNTVNCDDNCPGLPNADQQDLDNDGVGDHCDTDIDLRDQVFISDLDSAFLVGARGNAGTVFDGITMRDADLSGANLDGASFVGTTLTRAKLAGANLRGGNFAGTDFTEANLEQARLDTAILTDAVFVDADLDGARLTNADITGTSFLRTDLAGTDFGGTTACHTLFDEVEISDAQGLPGAIYAYAQGFVFDQSALDGQRLSGDFSGLTLIGLAPAGLGDNVRLDNVLIDDWQFTPGGDRTTHQLFMRSDTTNGCVRPATLMNSDWSGIEVDAMQAPWAFELRGAEITNVSFAQLDTGNASADFRDTGLTNVNFDLSNIDRSDFANASISGSRFIGATLTQSTFSAGTFGDDETCFAGANVSQTPFGLFCGPARFTETSICPDGTNWEQNPVGECNDTCCDASCNLRCTCCDDPEDTVCQSFCP